MSYILWKSAYDIVFFFGYKIALDNRQILYYYWAPLILPRYGQNFLLQHRRALNSYFYYRRQNFIHQDKKKFFNLIILIEASNFISVVINSCHSENILMTKAGKNNQNVYRLFECQLR